MMAATVAALPTATQADEKSKPIAEYRAFAVDLNGRVRGASSGTVDIVIERWSTDDEAKRLGDALKEGGSDSLLKTLQKVKPRVGYISTPGSLAYDLRFARQQTMADGSRRLLLGTDRRMSFFEVSRASRTTDYPFLIIDIRFGPNGEGQGKLLPVARVQYDPDDVVEVENYNAMPVQLTSVKPVD
jgi:hypothetical protein